ncbi:MAG: tetratricopeptide repeat protein [Minicystis sp.]
MPAAHEVLDLSGHPGAPPPIDVVQSLHDKSLLLRYEHPEQRTRARFRLYVGVREFAAEKLAERGGEGAAEARHARYFLAKGRAWAAAVDSPSAGEALHRLAVETENLLAVHRRALGRAPRSTESVTEAMKAALALERLLFIRGPHPLLLALLDGVLDGPHAAAVAAPIHAAALHARGKVHRERGRAERAQADLEQALARAEGAADVSLAGEIAVSLIRTHADCGRAERAEGCFARAVGSGDRRVEGRARARLALVRWRQGRHGEALDLLEAALRLHREVGDLHLGRPDDGEPRAPQGRGRSARRGVRRCRARLRNPRRARPPAGLGHPLRQPGCVRARARPLRDRRTPVRAGVVGVSRDRHPLARGLGARVPRPAPRRDGSAR